MTESVQQEVIKKLSAASKELQEAHRLAVKKNPMAQDLPVFQRVLKMQKDLTEVMQEVSKVRGL